MVARLGVGDKYLSSILSRGAQVALDGRCGRGKAFTATQSGTHQDLQVSLSVHRRGRQTKRINGASRSPKWRHCGNGCPKRFHLREGITGKQSGAGEKSRSEACKRLEK